MVLTALADRFPLRRTAIEQGLATVALTGRCQILPGTIETILDVAHNPGAAKQLALFLRDREVRGRTRMVLGMLADKDVAGFTAVLSPVVDEWYLATLPGERGLSGMDLQQLISTRDGIGTTQLFQEVASAYEKARADANDGDRVVVCGSFLTVAKALACHV
jgi:dihydrofolate synthase/folylpolyglutamate synthase